MPFLKPLATAAVAAIFMIMASSSFAANSGDGVTNAPSRTTSPGPQQDPSAKPRRHHHKHQRAGQRHHRRQQNPDQGPASGGSGQG